MRELKDLIAKIKAIPRHASVCGDHEREVVNSSDLDALVAELESWCPRCNGRGMILVGRTKKQDTMHDCPVCGGTGRRKRS